MTRRDFLFRASATSIVAVASCTPLRILMNPHPSDYRLASKKLDDTLRAFVVTIIPGAPITGTDLTRIYTDDYYPFFKYASFFAADLDTRALQLCGKQNFVALSSDERVAVVQNGLKADTTTSKLYKAAIYMAKASFFAGIYDAEGGCPLIEFEGSNNGFSLSEMCYPNARQYMAPEITQTGNYY